MPVTGSGDQAVYFEDHGSGPAVLLVPGLGGVCTCWAAQVPEFAREFRVIIHDHRGTGRSARPLMDYSVEQMTADVLRVMDACGVERAHLVGHSTGGAIGQIMAVDHPGRIASLVGANTWTHGDPYFKHVFRFRSGLLEQGRVDLYASAGSFMLWSPDWIAANIERVEREEKTMVDNFPDPRVAIARIDAITRFDRRRDLTRIKAPTLIIGAADDIITPPYFSEALARAIPKAELKMFPSGGHCFSKVLARDFNNAVKAFLRANTPSA